MFMWITNYVGIVPSYWLCCEHCKVYGRVIRDSRALKPAIDQDSGHLIPSSSDAQMKCSNLGKAELVFSGAGWKGGLMKPWAGHLHFISMDFTSSCSLCFPIADSWKIFLFHGLQDLHEWIDMNVQCSETGPVNRFSTWKRKVYSIF